MFSSSVRNTTRFYKRPVGLKTPRKKVLVFQCKLITAKVDSLGKADAL